MERIYPGKSNKLIESSISQSLAYRNSLFVRSDKGGAGGSGNKCQYKDSQ